MYADDDDGDVFDDDGQVVSLNTRIMSRALCPQIREHGLNLRTLIIAYIHMYLRTANRFRSSSSRRNFKADTHTPDSINIGTSQASPESK